MRAKTKKSLSRLLGIWTFILILIFNVIFPKPTYAFLSSLDACAAQPECAAAVSSELSPAVSVNLTDEQGFTPLLRAFQTLRNDDTVRLLVTHGADVNVRFPHGARSSPLSIAMGRENSYLLELMLAHGARFDLE